MKLRRNLNNWITGGLALAAASAAMPAMAQTSVTIYGVLDEAMVYSSNQNGPHNIYMRSGNLSASKLGFKGTEDLGGGLRALFTLENGFNADDGSLASSGVLFNRQSFVGLASNNGGTVLFGRQYTPYFLYVGAIGPTSVLTGATGAHPGDVDGLDTTVRISNAVTYISPTFGGAQVSALYGFGETAGSASTGNTYSLAAKWDVSAWNFALGYQRLRNGSGAATTWNSTASGSYSVSAVNTGYSSSNNVVMIAGAARYNVGDWMFGANLSTAQYNPGAGSLFTQKAKFNTVGVISTYQVSPAVALGAGYSYTRANAANGISNAAAYQQIALQQTYALSKRTAFYFLEAYQLAKGQTLSAAGAIINAAPAVGDSQNSTPSNGRNQTVVMVGIRHFF